MTTNTVEIPTAAAYRIDRSTISFTTRHLFGLASVRGTFQVREGEIHITDPVGGSSARATISAGSFDTGTPARDTTVRSAQYLDTGNHPDVTFRSTRLVHTDHWVLHGTLTVRGRACPVEVHITSLRPNGSTLHLRARARIDRYAFGITAMKGFVGRHLSLDLNLTATQCSRTGGVGVSPAG
jgi:polyisoprenoid-binding protein YceI